MVAQNVFHRASSHQIINLWRFAERCNIPWNLPTIFHPDLIATTLQTHLLSVCVLFSQIFPCSSLTVAWHSCGWWGRRAWGRHVEWSISCLEGVIDVEEGKLEEELVDKPGTTIGTKFSALHCIRIPFLMRCGFWPVIHSYEYPCSSQSFPSDKNC